MQILASALLAAAMAAQAVIASPIRARSPYAVKETHFAPREWTKLDRANGAKLVQLQIGLKQGNMDGLLEHLNEVSDPDHARYGAHLSADEIDELVRPSKETCDQVEQWLSEAGVGGHSYNTAKDWITVNLPLEFVEKLLDTEYHDYKHEDGAIISRTTHWSLPRHLHSHIDVIQPTTSFFRGAAHAATYVKTIDEVHDEVAKLSLAAASYGEPSDVSKVCNVSSVTPECFATLYKTKGYKTKAEYKNSIGFANYLEEVPIRPDTEQFLKKYRPEAVSSAKTFTTFSINGGPLNDGPLSLGSAANGSSHEANLDVQAIAGISWKTPIVSYSTGGRPPFIPDLTVVENDSEPYLVWVNWLLQQRSIPKIISTSYGEPEQTVPRSYAERVCKQFAAVGARGTTLFFSSGDSGLGGTNKCYTNDGKNTYKFLPAFPASCPYVTTVGATMNFEPEESAYRAARNVSGVFRDLYSSGSGFSNYFKQPAWQETAANAYVKSIGDLYKGLYNPAGRGYPDLAAQGLYFAYVWNGTEGTISGTSASTPLTAGIFALVNDALLASGKSSLGYLNPWLYKKGYKGLTDITKGSSHGCNVEGFPVTKGWDPITGFGTSIFPELVKLAGAKVW
ncbi:tripeptidyl-peptidase 1 precursor [Bimuria novae-zelandiae CBS 107.79]|uniref:tripeptidyl-peptidase II n=1 Tax=Bimuria novae-zelandiae CBS 107.79 TaxID=1447943 RepID=A0A6A5VBT7_9PLEO|nr:tripeptidyl-peptidase 1 precursor [Bimuria novae-zelandiae CBS 107.79]